jgi:hypothetical protein
MSAAAAALVVIKVISLFLKDRKPGTARGGTGLFV